MSAAFSTLLRWTVKWSDIDLEKGDLRVRRQLGRIDGKIIEMPLKTKNAYRTLPLSADAISVLMQQRRKTGNSEWVFPSPTGGPMSPDSVLQKLKKAIEENVGIDYGRAKTYTVGSWLEVWMENYAKIKLRPSTFKTSQGFLKNHIKPQIGGIPLADLTSLDLQRFYKHLLDGGRVDRIEAKKKPKGLAPKTVRNIHQMIGSAYNLAMEQKLVTRNPTQGCALPKVEHKEMKTLTADQLSAFFQEARDSGVYELYYLDLATGLRRGELLGLKWTDVDLNRGVLKIQRAISRQNGKVVEAPLKTKNAYRTLPLSADAISVLKMQKCRVGNSEWVFPSPTGGPMSPDSVLHMLQRVLKRAGLPRIRFHDLRHTFATMALQNGVDVKTVSSMLGHYSAGFTLDTYAHVTTDAQLKAAQTMGNILSRAV